MASDVFWIFTRCLLRNMSVGVCPYTYLDTMAFILPHVPHIANCQVSLIAMPMSNVFFHGNAVITGWLKKQQLRLKSAIFRVMGWNFGLNNNRVRESRIWNRISVISIPSTPKSQSKILKTVKILLVRILNFK